MILEKSNQLVSCRKKNNNSNHFTLPLVQFVFVFDIEKLCEMWNSHVLGHLLTLFRTWKLMRIVLWGPQGVPCRHTLGRESASIKYIFALKVLLYELNAFTFQTSLSEILTSNNTFQNVHFKPHPSKFTLQTISFKVDPPNLILQSSPSRIRNRHSYHHRLSISCNGSRIMRVLSNRFGFPIGPEVLKPFWKPETSDDDIMW